MSFNLSFRLACRFGNASLVNSMMKTDVFLYNLRNNTNTKIEDHVKFFNYGLTEAVISSNKTVIELLLSYGINSSFGLGHVCKNSNLKLVKLFIEKGKNNDYNYGLVQACQGGSLEIAKLMILHGADEFDLSFFYAFERNHLDIISLLAKDVNYISYYRYTSYLERIYSIIISYNLVKKIDPLFIPEINRYTFFNVMKINVSDDILSIIYKFSKITPQKINNTRSG